MTFSLIIPHKGPQELLNRCLASVPQRDDLQVIVVHDEDGRGAGWARNQGLARAEGDFLLFADSDDYFLESINGVLDRAKASDADLVFFNANSKEECSDEPSWRTVRLNSLMQKKSDEREFLLRHSFTEPWCHIVRRSLVEEYNIRFDETPIVNDAWFTTQVGYRAHSVLVMEECAYCVVNRKSSTAKLYDAVRLLTTAQVLARINRFNILNDIAWYHSRMMRPFMFSMFTGHWTLACKCWKAMKSAGYPTPRLLWYVIRYPFDLFQSVRRRLNVRKKNK